MTFQAQKVTLFFFLFGFFFISITISKFFLKMYSFFISTMAVVDSRKILRKFSFFFSMALILFRRKQIFIYASIVSTLCESDRTDCNDSLLQFKPP